MSQRAQIFIIELIYTDMKQDEKWLRKYEEVVELVDEQMTLGDEDVFWRFCVKWDGKC